MASVAGKKARIKISATDGSYNAIAGVDNFSHSIAGASVDDSEMGVDWMQRIAGLQDGKLTVAAARRLSDTTGQTIAQTGILAGTPVYVEVTIDGTNGFKQQMYCTKFGTDAAVADKVKLAMEFEGSGAITIIP